MTLDDYNAICKSLLHTTHVVQWGGAHVWKIGGKVFAIAGWQEEGAEPYITFKCSRMSFDLLKEEPGCRPAPYLASRGLLWIQCTGHDSLSRDNLAAYLLESYRLAAAGLTKRLRRELELE